MKVFIFESSNQMDASFFSTSFRFVGLNNQLLDINFFPSVILKPIAPRPGKSVLYSSLALVGTVSIGIAIPYVLRLQSNTCSASSNKFLSTKGYFISVVIWMSYTWCIPQFIITTIYFLTTRALKANTFKHANNRAMEQRNKQNARIVKMFVIIIVIFYILTMPYGLFHMYFEYINLYDPKNAKNSLLNTIKFVLFIPVSANGCVNPIIYGNMHRGMNKFIRNNIIYPIVECFRCKQRENNGTHSWTIRSSKHDQTSM